MSEPKPGAKRAKGHAIKLDKAAADQFNKAKLPKGKKQESAEVSAQYGGPWNGWVRNPYDGEWYHFSGLWYGYNTLEAGGHIWSQFIDD